MGPIKIAPTMIMMEYTVILQSKLLKETTKHADNQYASYFNLQNNNLMRFTDVDTYSDYDL
jgi:hypothetical protein